MKEAPLFVRALDLTQWLLANLHGEGPLPQRIQHNALALLDHVVLALKNFDRDAQLEQADALTALLRVQLRLAHTLHLLQERQLLFLTGELDDIGRQLGGWQRRLEADHAPRRR